jgi:hypothetical protein
MNECKPLSELSSYIEQLRFERDALVSLVEREKTLNREAGALIENMRKGNDEVHATLALRERELEARNKELSGYREALITRDKQLADLRSHQCVGAFHGWQDLDGRTSRLKVPGGWLVMVVDVFHNETNSGVVRHVRQEQRNATMSFVPDPAHAWMR